MWHSDTILTHFSIYHCCSDDYMMTLICVIQKHCRWRKKKHWNSWEGRWFHMLGLSPNSTIPFAHKSKNSDFWHLFLVSRYSSFFLSFLTDGWSLLHIIGQLEKSRRQSHHSCVCSREEREENFWVQFPAPLPIGDEVDEKFGWLVQELLNLN